MLVCVCNGVSDKDIDAEILDGTSECKQIRGNLGIGNCCGQCTRFAKDLINQKMTQQQSAMSQSLSYAVSV